MRLILVRSKSCAMEEFHPAPACVSEADLTPLFPTIQSAGRAGFISGKTATLEEADEGATWDSAWRAKSNTDEQRRERARVQTQRGDAMAQVYAAAPNRSSPRRLRAVKRSRSSQRSRHAIIEADLCRAQCNVGASSTIWGRHGFDGIACGREACRGVDTRNRSQNYKCRTSIRACCLNN